MGVTGDEALRSRAQTDANEVADAMKTWWRYSRRHHTPAGIALRLFAIWPLLAVFVSLLGIDAWVASLLTLIVLTVAGVVLHLFTASRIRAFRRILKAKAENRIATSVETCIACEIQIARRRLLAGIATSHNTLSEIGAEIGALTAVPQPRLRSGKRDGFVAVDWILS